MVFTERLFTDTANDLNITAKVKQVAKLGSAESSKGKLFAFKNKTRIFNGYIKLHSQFLPVFGSHLVKKTWRSIS